MASNARNLSKLLGTSTQVPTTALPQAIADLETIGTSLSGGDIAPKNISSNTLTQSFDSNQTVNFIMSDSIDTVSPIISVFKEVPQPGVSSKGSWDVNANATNYDFYDEKPISYSSVSLTPSATGDGTFTSSNPVVVEFDVANMAYNNKSYDFTTQSSVPEGGGWGNNGTVFFMCTNSFNRMYSYTASTAYDISTLTYDNKYIAISSPYSDPCDVIISDDGTKFWGTGRTDVIVGEFVMSTPFDLSTATYNNSSLDMSAQLDGNARSISFGDNGTKLYATGYGASNVNSKVVQYNLSTAYDLSTASYSGNSIDLTSTYPGVTTAKINADGTKMLIAAYRQDEVHLFTLSTPYDLSTASDSGISYNFSSTVNTTANSTCGGTTNPDGSEFYYFGGFAADGNAYQFNMGGSSVFNAADVGKKVIGNSGTAVITSTAGAYKSVTPFADTSAISSWQLYGGEGKSDGTGIQLTGIAVNDVYNLSAASYDNKSFDASSQLPGAQGVAFKDDGTAMYLIGYTNDTVYQYTLSTAWDVSTASYSNKSFSVATQDAVPRDIRFKSDGTSFYVIASSAPDSIYQYDLSTAWDVSTASYSNKSFSVQTQTDNPSGLAVSADGTKFYVCPYGSTGSTTSYQYDLTTAWDISTASYSNKSFTSTSGQGQQESIDISSDGLKFFVCGTLDDAVLQYDLSTAWDITTASTTHSASLSPADVGLNGVLTNGWYNFAFSATGHKFYSFGNSNEIVYQISTGAGIAYTHPYSQYSPALTNSSSGQINSSSWTDINSMTADETKNGGDIFYAVSTDNRTSWGVAKGSDGVRKIARNNSGTWQYNNNGGSSTSTYYNADGATYNSAQSGSAQGGRSAIYFNSSGTKSIKSVMDAGYFRVRSFTYTTAYDLTTESYTGETFNPAGSSHSGLYVKPDGTKFYVTDYGADQVIQYDMPTSFDPSSATAGGNGTFTLTSTGVTQNNIDRAYGIEFKPDGTRMYVADWNQNGASYMKYVQYNLSTPWDVTTASHAGQWVLSGSGVRDLAFWPDGTKVLAMYDNGSGSNVRAQQYTLSVAWDITSTMTATPYYLDIGTNAAVSTLWGGKYAKNGELFIVDGTYVFNMGVGGSITGYGTGETWVNGTNNNEHATLQQALTSQSFNRMNKAQLDTVADGYHFSQDSADTLDLMIAPYAASGASPVSDGVTINYDAEALVREAIAGTDYIAEFPSPNRLDIKSLINGNLKIRAQ